MSNIVKILSININEVEHVSKNEIVFEEYAKQINLDEPIEMGNNFLSMNINYGNNSLYLQTPRLYFDFNNNDNKNELNLKFKGKKESQTNHFYKFLKRLEDRLAYLLESEMEKITNELSFKNILRSSIKVPENIQDPMYINTQLSENVQIYDKYDKQLPLKEYTQCYCTFIISCKDISIYPSSAHINWTIEQVLIHSPNISKKSNQSKKFQIKMDHEPKKGFDLDFKQLSTKKGSKNTGKNKSPENEESKDSEDIKENKKEMLI